MLLLRIKIKVLMVVLVLLATGALLVFVRGFFFSSDDVVLALTVPDELDIGSVQDVYLTVTNSTRRALTDGSFSLDVPQGTEVVEISDASFVTLASRAQATARFRVRAQGSPGEKLELNARVRFRPGKLSAVLERRTVQTIRLRDLPFELSLSFPSDVASGQPFTFFVRFASRAEAPIGPVGLTLAPPESFRLIRTKPASSTESDGMVWDFGTLSQGGREEITVTGIFDSEVSGGEFLARIGILDASRKSLASSKETREFLNLEAGAVPIDVLFGSLENVREVVVAPGDTLNFTLRYTNAMSAAAEDVSVLFALAHDAIDQRKVTSSEKFRRSLSGEFLWDPEDLFSLRALEPGAAGTVTVSAALSKTIPMRTFNDTNQTIAVRARTMSGGRVLGERHMLLKIAGTLSVNAGVRYYNAPGGNNEGPIPPRVGQETTYTATLIIAGGMNGLSNVTSRVVLGPSVSYVTSLEPTDAKATYDEATREILWSIGDVPPGVGILSPPKKLSFRIALTPQASDVGKAAELVSSVTTTGKDTFTERTLDAEDKPVDTNLPDDSFVSSLNALVQP